MLPYSSFKRIVKEIVSGTVAVNVAASIVEKRILGIGLKVTFKVPRHGLQVDAACPLLNKKAE